MYSHADSSFQGIMYKPNFDENIKLDKKFMKRRKQIFQSLNMRKPHQKKPLEDSQIGLSASPQYKKKSAQKLHLPDIYLYSKPKHQEIISIEDKDKLVKEISKSLNFINKKMPVLNFDFNSIFDEDTKSISYDSEVYKKELQVMKMIFGQCGINLKPRDMMVLEGQKSKSQYIIFTNHPKHPQSLCCKSEIVIKHVQFLSPKKLYFAKEKSFEVPLKSFIALLCMKCSHDIMKIRPLQNFYSRVEHPVSDYEEQKRLLSYSKLISSGRFKKALINDESVEIMKGRKNPLARSKSKIEKLHEISQSQKVKHLRYTDRV